VANFEDAAAEEASGGCGAHDCGEIVFLCERGDHLAGAGGVLIHKDHDAPVEFLRSHLVAEKPGKKDAGGPAPALQRRSMLPKEDAEGTGNVGERKNRCGRQGIFGLAYKRDSSLRSE